MAKKAKKAEQPMETTTESAQVKEPQTKIDPAMERAVIGLFRVAILDRMTGKYNAEHAELMERLSIEPILGYKLIDSFIGQINGDIGKGKLPTIKIRQLFYKQLCDMFCNKPAVAEQADNEWK